MAIPRRLRALRGTHAVVDGIHFEMPIDTSGSRAFMAAFPINARRAAALLPGRELHPFRLWGRGLLLITVVDYQKSDIGKYIEFSLAIACTRGLKPAPRLLPLLMRRRYGFGQYVLDLPVSTEVSVKGGKGIWGMPKHRASLDFLDDGQTVTSQYDLDGRLAVRIDIARPKTLVPGVTVGAANYCVFRGMLVKSYVHFQGKPAFALPGSAKATLTVGGQLRVAWLKTLEVTPQPLFTVYYPRFGGVLDDYFESWFLCKDTQAGGSGEGLESVFGLGQSQEWPPPPKR